MRAQSENVILYFAAQAFAGPDTRKGRPLDKVALFLILAAAAQPALAERAQAELECRFTGADFVYDCTIRLTRGGKPLPGARVTVSADMPSMPIAHNVRPVKAQPSARPGEYAARLDLEMTGEWAVKLRLAGPVRDLLTVHYEFDERGARPAKPATRSGTPPRR